MAYKMMCHQRFPSSYVFVLLIVAACGISCDKQQQPPAEASAAGNPAPSSNNAPTAQPVSVSAPAGSTTAKPQFDGKRAMQYVKEVVAMGARPPGSAAHAKLEQYILAKLHGVDVEQDKFTAQTPVGKFPINNIIAKFPGKKRRHHRRAGHYDTNYPLPKHYVGANDGGSSTGVLLELADQLRGKQLDGYSVWLLWTDGEEAFVKWTRYRQPVRHPATRAEVAGGRYRRKRSKRSFWST